MKRVCSMQTSTLAALNISVRYNPPINHITGMTNQNLSQTERDLLEVPSKARHDEHLKIVRKSLITLKAAAADEGCDVGAEVIAEMEAQIDELERMISQNNLSR